jgi:hypothetical protein
MLSRARRGRPSEGSDREAGAAAGSFAGVSRGRVDGFGAR